MIGHLSSGRHGASQRANGRASRGPKVLGEESRFDDSQNYKLWCFLFFCFHYNAELFWIQVVLRYWNIWLAESQLGSDSVQSIYPNTVWTAKLEDGAPF